MRATGVDHHFCCLTKRDLKNSWAIGLSLPDVKAEKGLSNISPLVRREGRTSHHSFWVMFYTFIQHFHHPPCSSDLPSVGANPGQQSLVCSCVPLVRAQTLLTRGEEGLVTFSQSLGFHNVSGENCISLRQSKEKTICSVTPEILGYFSTMTQHFFCCVN